MSAVFSVPLTRLVGEFALEAVYEPENIASIEIVSVDVNRPGLHLTGFLDFFDNQRIQVFGKSELGYLESIGEENARKSLECYFEKKPPVVIVTRGLEVPDDMTVCANKFGVPLYKTQDTTSTFMSGLISILNVELAPRITRHGVLVEVYGEGILLLGDSGVGKSETAIELVKRGHRLIADDAVEIRRVSNRTLVGSSPANIRHFIELRGIGIVNARRIFGMGSVKMTEKIDMVIQLELWDPDKVYDRMGLENEYTSILGLQIPSLTIPVKPGRNLAVILEVASMNNRQKKMGYNAAAELMENLGMSEPAQHGERNREWDLFY